MMNWLKNIFSKNKIEETPKEVYSFAGHTFRVLDPGKLSPRRQLAIHSKAHEREAGISPEDHAKALRVVSNSLVQPSEWKHAKELAAKERTNSENARTVLEDLAILLEEDHAYKPFIKSGCAFILIDDEKTTDDPYGKYYDKKLELCQRHQEIEDFFLRISYGFHHSTLSTFAASSIWEWYPSKAIKQVENRIMKVIQSSIYSNGFSKETKTKDSST